VTDGESNGGDCSEILISKVSDYRMMQCSAQSQHPINLSAGCSVETQLSVVVYLATTECAVEKLVGLTQKLLT